MSRPFSASLGGGTAAQRFAKTNPAAAQRRSTTDLESLRKAPAQLRDILGQHRTTLDAGRRAIDENTDLTKDGRAKYKATLQANAGNQTWAAVAAVRQRVEAAHSALMAQADRTRPQPVAGVEGMLGRQAAWARSRSLLDAGMAPHKLIGETTDPETLHALADELPTYLRSKGTDIATAQAIGQPIADRMAEIAGEPHRSAHLSAREAQVHMAGLTHELGNAEAVANGRGGDIASAVAAQIARQRAARGTTGETAPVDAPAESGLQAAQYAVKPGPPAPTGDAA